MTKLIKNAFHDIFNYCISRFDDRIMFSCKYSILLNIRFSTHVLENCGQGRISKKRKKKTCKAWKLKKRVFWAYFMVIFWGPNPYIPAKTSPKKQNLKISMLVWISLHQSIDNSFLSSQKKFSPVGPKMA